LAIYGTYPVDAIQDAKLNTQRVHLIHTIVGLLWHNLDSIHKTIISESIIKKLIHQNRRAAHGNTEMLWKP